MRVGNSSWLVINICMQYIIFPMQASVTTMPWWPWLCRNRLKIQTIALVLYQAVRIVHQSTNGVKQLPIA